MLRQCSLALRLLVACVFSLILLGTPQHSTAGPTGQICFEEACCYIGARDKNLNCSTATVACARQLAGNFVGYTFNSRPVGSVKDCPIHTQGPEQLSSTMISLGEEQKIQQEIERLRIESIAQYRIELDRYNNCLTPEHEGSKHSPLATNLDKLRCQSLEPTHFRIRNLILENATLNKDNLRLEHTNESLKRQVEALESENTELKKLWSLYQSWVRQMLSDKGED